MSFRMNRFAAMSFAILAADNGGGSGGSTETASTETASTNERSDAVTDEAIIIAMHNASENVNDDGEIVGTLADVCEETGMNRGSLNGRLTALRKLGCDFPKLARSPAAEGSKTRKKDPVKVLALFNKINGNLGEAKG